MDRFTRILQLHRILVAARRPVSRRSLEERLECSKATVCRAIAHLRDDLGAPVTYDAEANGYYYPDHADTYELPGLWLSASEIEALLTAQMLLVNIDNGLLTGMIAPFHQRLERILQHERLGGGEFAHRVRIFPVGARPVPEDVFKVVAAALGDRKRLRIFYTGRGRSGGAERIVSPLRLINYRHNWYLDGWCHLREALRTFALELIERPQQLAEAAKEVSDDEMDAHFANGYGIFAGQPEQTAILHFTDRSARWVRDEIWHPQQQGVSLPDGSYELQLPFSRAEELIMDVMRHGAQVEVIAPLSLRREVLRRHREAVARYEETGDIT